MRDNSPIIVWFRRDLRLSDHVALTAAASTGRPIIPVFIRDPLVDGLGAAAKLRLGLAIDQFSSTLRSVQSRLTLRHGDAPTVLKDLIAQTGATSVYWSRLYDPSHKDRDTAVKAALKDAGIDAQSFTGHLLFEPWTVTTKTGGFYKVFTPMWKTVRTQDVGTPLLPPVKLRPPEIWPETDSLRSWDLAAGMQRGAQILAHHCVVGEGAAHDRLDQFVEDKLLTYATSRDQPGANGTSGLSENLTYGEISPRQCWHAGWGALQDGKSDAEVFLRELVWREFAYHLAHHTPHILTDNWKPAWDKFPWNTGETAETTAWKQGRTGVPFVDAAMREMYVTGVMHNRGRMIVASYLTKHLLTHWKIGLDWFAECLIDWDPCSNAMGWQWAAGSGPDASPYFRIFNPLTQLKKFDPEDNYATRWIAEGNLAPSAASLSYFDMIPKRWGMQPTDMYPAPIVDVSAGRARALAAYQVRDTA
ncbi:deoxyribodipyrimidine photo-lyase [Loktanella sp. D2R18]|uniref:cryptochrome/photolyase family protein n=1 Tax=Rhodobacterales TaxID=204455 RepID=UPI000DE9C836|nr:MULTISPECIES: deoxyribodipyrimidine photo-lyase [Rhodobacterales]MDO6590764.1 deoxyribodipyrimidine photo-lyase [Yoonia sp. 1_MG-2023]RBW44620.1 deoxyribodipyrimidine photo-lyase [Loktanella sp. D2R18]